MPAIAIGTAQFGLNYGATNSVGMMSRDEAQGIIDLARKSGITHLDTAIAYGASEETLGEIGIRDFKITSKLPRLDPTDKTIRATVLKQVEESLKRLKIDSIECFLLHSPSDLMGASGDQLWTTLLELVDERIATRVGISVYSCTDAQNIIRKFAVTAVQCPFNFFDRGAMDPVFMRSISENNIELQIRSIFLQGILLCDPERRPKYFDRWDDLFQKWDLWTESDSELRLKECLAFALHFEQAAKVIVGVDSTDQLRKIIDAQSYSLSEKFPKISGAALALTDPRIWNLSEG